MEADGLRIKAQATLVKDASSVQWEELFESLMAENGAALFRLAAGFTNSAADRDDLFQEMVLAIWKSLPKFRGESSARTYLFRVAHNRGIAYLVRRRMFQANEAEQLAVRDPAPGPERQLEAKEQRQRLLDAVRRLPFAYREVITLALEGLNYAEIGEVTGLSEANIGKRLSRAKTVLRELLELRK